MRRLLFILLSLFLISSFLPLKAQDMILNSAVTGVCYAGKNVNRIYIPPPEDFYKKKGPIEIRKITVVYSGFPAEAIEAIDYAVSILESLLPADTRIRLLANWQNLGSSGVLGNSGIAGFVGGWSIDALNPLAYYPVTLAEKIAGTGINGDLEGDIELTINSTINWYLATDGNTPSLKYDLVTVVIHELCHGLGFFNSMYVEGSIGSYGINSIPLIYDTFIETLSGLRLTDTLEFRNPSANLRSMLTGGQLYFNGPLLKNYTSGSRAKLYAPDTWDPGSSIAHLDEDLTVSPNTLLTPFIALGEAIHNPGKYTLSILGDLGWINTKIVHKPMRDTEEYLTEITISANVKSDTLFNRDKVGVVYSFDKFTTSDTIFLASPNSDDTFTTLLPIPSYNTDLQYYIFAEDIFLRTYRSPSFIELFHYQVYIGTDTIKPSIEHTPVDYYLETTDSIRFIATATDRKGIDSVYIEYKINDDGVLKYVGLNAGIINSYKAVINAKPELLNGGDSLMYRIFAVDSALIPNISVLPDIGYIVTDIEDIEVTVQSYSTDFTGAESDFLNYGFDISTPSGFSGSSLNSKHPYDSPEDNNKHYDFTALLRYPLKFDESGMLINFREIVLVEPGEPGTIYPSDDFYDYVIVEGSRDFAKSWFRLSEGYDSRYVKSWETNYNDNIVDMRSTFVPTETMLNKHTIFYKPSANISAGDTMLLRFRLYSDPFANGWGWIIDDLEINPLIDAVEEIYYDPVKIFPNPGKGLINVRSDNEEYNIRLQRFSVYNSAGICLIKDRSFEGNGNMIDISSHPTGIYIIVLYRDDGIKTYKYSLIK